MCLDPAPIRRLSDGHRAIQNFSGSLLSPAPVPRSRVQIQSTFFWGAVCLCQGHGLLAVEVNALSPGVLALCLLSAGHLPRFSGKCLSSAETEQNSPSAAPRAYPSGAGLCGSISARAQPLLQVPGQGTALRAAVEPTLSELWAGVLVPGRELTGYSVGASLSDWSRV